VRTRTVYVRPADYPDKVVVRGRNLEVRLVSADPQIAARGSVEQLQGEPMNVHRIWAEVRHG